MGLISRLLDSKKAFFLLVCSYFLLQLAIRLSVSNSLDLDESEQIFQAQWWLLGYGPQPPLYNWIQQLFLAAFGQNLLALSLLKNLLLLSTWTLTYLVGLRVLQKPRLAALATLALVFIPQIGWESQRDLTHSVLVTTLAVATIVQGFRLLDKPSIGNYLILGVLVGLGCNAKYSYLLFATVLFLTVVSLGDVRRIILQPVLALSALVALLMCIPHWWWLFNHVDAATDSTLAKLMRPTSESFWALRFEGVVSLATAAFQFSVLLLLIFAGFFLRNNTRQAPENTAGRLLQRYFLVLACVFVIVVSVTGVNFIKDRWMQPLLVLLPVYLFSIVHAGQSRRHAGYALMALVFLGLIPVLLTLRVTGVDMTARPERLNLPYAELVNQAFPDQFPDSVITDRSRTAGNIRFQLRKTSVLSVEHPDLGKWDAVNGKNSWIIWNTSDLKDPQKIPQPLVDAVNNLGLAPDINGMKFIEANYLYSSNQQVKFGLVKLVPAG